MQQFFKGVYCLLKAQWYGLSILLKTWCYTFNIENSQQMMDQFSLSLVLIYTSTLADGYFYTNSKQCDWSVEFDQIADLKLPKFWLKLRQLQSESLDLTSQISGTRHHALFGIPINTFVTDNTWPFLIPVTIAVVLLTNYPSVNLCSLVTVTNVFLPWVCLAQGHMSIAG